MSKSKKVNLENKILKKILTNQIKMKPRWYFIVGSSLLLLGITLLSFTSIFLTNLTIFLIHKRGPGSMRLEMMINSFPWWVPILAICGIISGILLFKKYDISYKKNFLFLIIGFIITILLTAFLINSLGFNENWSRKKPLMRFYRQFEQQNKNYPKGPGNRLNQRFEKY